MGGGSGGGFKGTKGSHKNSRADKDAHLYGKPGQVIRNGYKEATIGKDGRAILERHHTNHGFPKHHTNPHDHEIQWSQNGNPIYVKEKR